MGLETGNLSEKQLAFASEYIIDFNATQAAIRAGYSERTAKQQGSRLLTNVDLQAQLVKLIGERNERAKYDADKLLEDLLSENAADIADLYDENTNTLKPVHDWPKRFRYGLVQSVKVTELYDKVMGDDGKKHREKIGETVEVKLVDRLRLREVIGKHVNVQAFKEKVEHDLSDPMQELAAALSGRSIKPKG